MSRPCHLMLSLYFFLCPGLIFAAAPVLTNVMEPDKFDTLQEAHALGGGEHFGSSMAISGNTLVVGMPDDGTLSFHGFLIGHPTS